METQKLVAQFRLQFAGPIDADWQVNTESDLLHLDNNYDHRLVWCKATKAMYYLRSGHTGQDAADWKMYGKQLLTEWVSNVSYDMWECVYDEFGVYIALQDVPSGTPVTDYEYWLKVSTNIVTIYREFEDVSYVEIPVKALGIEHPLFQVYIGNTVAYGDIERVEEGENETWRISFFENGELTAKTGYIVIK